MLSGVLLLSLTSCVSAPTASMEPLTVRKLDKAAIKSAYGVRFKSNPYLEPFRLFSGQKEEFAIVEARFNLEEASLVLFDAAVYGPDGTIVAKLFDRKALHEFWSDWDGIPNPEQRSAAIDNACLPLTSYKVPKGNKRYFLVCIGPNPLPRPAIMRGYIFIEGRDIAPFEYLISD